MKRKKTMKSKTKTVAATKKGSKSVSRKSADKKPYVYSSTIWKAVGGGFSNPGERRIVHVGKYKVMLSRAQRLDQYGNPVHTASVIRKDGTVGGTYRSNGSASLTVSRALEKEGVETKRKRIQRKKK